MKYRYLSVFLILLVLSVGAVSAQENTTADNDIDVLQDASAVVSSEYVIDDSNYDTYFNSTTGFILENSNISDGDTIRFGNIANKTFMFNKQLTITSNSSFNVISNSTICFIDGSDNSQVTDLWIINQNFDGIAISITEINNISIKDSIIDVSGAEGATLFAIYADSVNNLELITNVFTYVGKSDGNAVNNAIRIIDSDDVSVENNTFDISIPSCDVAWLPDGDGGWVKTTVSEGIVVDDCIINFNNNEINVNYNNVTSTSGYDTIYSLDFNVDESFIENNTIISEGHSYVYGIIIEGSFVVANNIISSYSDNYYANGIDIEGTTEFNVVYNNTISAESPVVAYPVYSSMSGSDVEVYYVNNTICGVSDIVYGMELAGTNETVVGNEIISIGNKTTGIASKSKYLVIGNNTITADGDNLGNTTTWESFPVITTGIYLYNVTGYVVGNEINSTSNGILATLSELNIINNTLNVEDNGLNSSYGIAVDSGSLVMNSNTLTYVGNSDGNTINNAIRIIDSDDVSVENNTFDISIPSCDVAWLPDGDGGWVKTTVSEGIVVDDCIINFNNNEINVNYNNVTSTSGYDTIYSLDFNVDESFIENNTIISEGHSYVYGIIIEGSFVVANNIISSYSDNYYANGIDIEGTTEFNVVYNNTISAESPVVAYPVYSSMSGSDVEVYYVNNTICGVSDIVYGMELAGTNETVVGNEIISIGNKTTGIASKSKYLVIGNNTITVEGDNLGNTTVWESFPISTTGIYLYNVTGYVVGNEINSTSNGILATLSELNIINNTLNVEDNGLDSSYGIAVDSVSVVINSNNITYVGNSNGTNKNAALYIFDADNVTVSDNYFDVEIPSLDVAYDLDWNPTVVSQGVFIEEVTNLTFNNNGLYVMYNNNSGMYDSLYALRVIADNATVDNNEIFILGHSYAYGVVATGEDIIISNNTIHSDSDDYYAAAISLEGEGSYNIVENDVYTHSEDVTYGIRTSTFSGNLTSDIGYNDITMMSPISYAIYLSGTNDVAGFNNIESHGNFTIGVASSAQNATICSNVILANGSNVGNSSTIDTIEPETVGVKVVSGIANVASNRITSSGNYTVNVTDTDSTVSYNYLIANGLYGDNSVYANGSADIYNNTPQFNIKLEGADVVMFYKNGTRYVVNLTTIDGKIPYANKTVTIIINGVSYDRVTNENGSASMAINLSPGIYDVSVIYESGEDYLPITTTNEIEVISTIYGEDITKIYKNGTQYYATFIDGQGNFLADGAEVTFNINGVMYKRFVNGSEGRARLNINLDPGTYILTAINPVNGEMASNNVTVLATFANNTDLVKYYRNGSQYIITVLGEDGKVVGAGENVTFNINGVMYTRQTNESGQAKLNINLDQGEYIITAMYNGCMASNTITVLPILITHDLVIKYGTSDQFRAILVDDVGNPYPNQNVTFNINGRIYYRTTDIDGLAVLNIKLGAAISEYLITSSYGTFTVGNKISIVP